MQKAGIDADRIEGIAVTGHGNGMYLVDAQGAPTSSGINSADTRASEYVRRWYANGTAERLLPRICQSVWPAQPVALLAWFRDHRPEVLERTRWVFMCKDFYEEQRVELALAYAVSVHKSRGCEFPAVIVPVLTQHYLLLQRNLIYTAVTRGKRLVVLVGARKALAMALKNADTQERYTGLRARLAAPAVSG